MSLSRGSMSRGVSVQGGLCPGGLSPGESLSRGTSVDRDPPGTVKSGRYASYWNAFLYNSKFLTHDVCNFFCRHKKRNQSC